MSGQADMSSRPLPPEGRDADILPFKRREGETLDPNVLTVDGCVAFFIHKWNDPTFDQGPRATLINEDCTSLDDSDERQDYLQETIENSPVFDHYDALIDTDPIAKLLDTRLRESLPSLKGEEVSPERRAAFSLLYLRGAQVITDTDQPIEPQLTRLPLGDEDLWETLVDQLIAKP